MNIWWDLDIQHASHRSHDYIQTQLLILLESFHLMCRSPFKKKFIVFYLTYHVINSMLLLYFPTMYFLPVCLNRYAQLLFCIIEYSYFCVFLMRNKRKLSKQTFNYYNLSDITLLLVIALTLIPYLWTTVLLDLDTQKKIVISDHNIYYHTAIVERLNDRKYTKQLSKHCL